MDVDRNAVIKLQKSGKSNVEIAKRLDMNRSTVWKIVKIFQEIESPLTDPDAEENGVSAPLNTSKHEGKAVTKPSPKLQNLDHLSRHEQMHHAPGIEGRSGGEALQDAALPGAYGQSPNMQGNPPGNGRRHAAEPISFRHGRKEI